MENNQRQQYTREQVMERFITFADEELEIRNFFQEGTRSISFGYRLDRGNVWDLDREQNLLENFVPAFCEKHYLDYETNNEGDYHKTYTVILDNETLKIEAHIDGGGIKFGLIANRPERRYLINRKFENERDREIDRGLF